MISAIFSWFRCILAATLYQRALRIHGTAGDPWFALATHNYEQVLKIRPDWFTALNDRGVMLLEMAKRKQAAGQDLLDQACLDLRRAVQLRPKHFKAQNNLALALSRQARLTTGLEADRLFDAADRHFAAALEIMPNQVLALCNWCAALNHQAKQKSGAEADRLFAQACEKCQAALAINPRHDGALMNWGVALMNQGKQKPGDQARGPFGKARGKFLQVEALRPGFAAYNLACLSAVEGKEQECRAWLEKSRSTGDLPRHYGFATDEDFDSVRDCLWFHQLVVAQKS